MSSNPQGQLNDISSLLGKLPGMAYRSAFEPFRTLRFASPGCYTLTGYQPGELIGEEKLSFGDLIKPDDRRSSWQKIMAAASNGRPYNVEYRIQHRNGNEVWVRDSGQAVYSTEGSWRC
ncbi:MAG: PAS domain-containing protein [Chloroflexi bacterium]|nr:MAG: PAS domain-containing protein [Chloroflexota bacterium]